MTVEQLLRLHGPFRTVAMLIPLGVGLIGIVALAAVVVLFHPSQTAKIVALAVVAVCIVVACVVLARRWAPLIRQGRRAGAAMNAVTSVAFLDSLRIDASGGASSTSAGWMVIREHDIAVMCRSSAWRGEGAVGEELLIPFADVQDVGIMAGSWMYYPKLTLQLREGATLAFTLTPANGSGVRGPRKAEILAVKESISRALRKDTMRELSGQDSPSIDEVLEQGVYPLGPGWIARRNLATTLSSLVAALFFLVFLLSSHWGVDSGGFLLGSVAFSALAFMVLFGSKRLVWRAHRAARAQGAIGAITFWSLAVGDVEGAVRGLGEGWILVCGSELKIACRRQAIFARVDVEIDVALVDIVDVSVVDGTSLEFARLRLALRDGRKLWFTAMPANGSGARGPRREEIDEAKSLLVAALRQGAA